MTAAAQIEPPPDENPPFQPAITSTIPTDSVKNTTATVRDNPHEASRQGKSIARRLSKPKQRLRVAEMAELMGEVVRKLRGNFASVSVVSDSYARSIAQIVRAASDAENQVRLARGEPLPGFRRHPVEIKKPRKKPAAEVPLAPDPTPPPAPEPVPQRPAPRPSSPV